MDEEEYEKLFRKVQEDLSAVFSKYESNGPVSKDEFSTIIYATSSYVIDLMLGNGCSVENARAIFNKFIQHHNNKRNPQKKGGFNMFTFIGWTLAILFAAIVVPS